MLMVSIETLRLLGHFQTEHALANEANARATLYLQFWKDIRLDVTPKFTSLDKFKQRYIDLLDKARQFFENKK